MKSKVFSTKELPLSVEEFLAPHCDIIQWDGDYPIRPDQAGDIFNDVEGIIGSNMRITEELLDLAPKLKIVSNRSVGYDNFDTKLMAQRHIMGTHTPYVLDDTVADLAMGMILGIARRIPELNNYVKSGNWKASDFNEFFGYDIHGKTLGIIGLGRIGTKMAKRAAMGFDMNVMYYSRTRKEDLEAEYKLIYSDLDELLKKSDFVVLMLPLTDKTHKFIGAREFSLMKKSAFFINISRGKIVDEEALINALKNGEIAGAALDVFEKEPVDPKNPLLSMDNVLTLPHIGSSTEETIDAMAMVAARNLLAGLSGQRPENLVPELR